ncbi:hypothetical protein AB4079_13685 [Leifsonia sp. 2MCAF36]
MAVLGALTLGASLIAAPAAQAASAPPATAQITVNGASGGRTFDGIGAVSGGGATSRLLLDYPVAQRDQILDYLFEPNYGASLQLLKVEIGGDTNTTDGSESSHEHARGVVDCNAGYEWWLMKEAVRRNPNIKLGALAWGAPGWIGNGEYYSDDNIEYMLDWLGCAKSQGLTIDNMGVRNERTYDAAWIKQFRAALDKAGYTRVRIIASDEAASHGAWPIADAMAADPALNDAVGLLGNHYSTGPSSDTAQTLNKPLWVSEGGPWSAEWGAGGALKSIPAELNHNYIQGRITGDEIWNLITSYYEGLSISDAGLMRANTPWSGEYTVQSAIWAMAQTTQFTQPGWHYLDDSSGYLDNSDQDQGSYVSLRSPRGGDWSTVIENIGTTAPRTVTLSTTGGLKKGPLHVWQTTATQSFERQADLRIDGQGQYTVTIPANSTVSITTTSGQHHGDAAGPAASAFPFPFTSSLATGGASGQTPYFSQMEGAYEERPCHAGRSGTCLAQVSPQPAISWAAWKQPAGIVGDLDWSNYTTSVDTYIPAGGTGEILGRAGSAAMPSVPNGYGLTLAADGSWSVGKGVGGRTWQQLSAGQLGGASTGWHTLALGFAGNDITASIDGEQVSSVTDSDWQSGMVGLSGNYAATQFQNLSVKPLADVATVDDSVQGDGGIAYTSTDWEHCGSSHKGKGCEGFTPDDISSAYGGTVSASNRAGATATVNFTGTQVKLYGVLSRSGGAADLTVDGSSPATLSFATAGGRNGAASGLVWESPVLPSGPHTLKVVVAGSHGGNGWVGIDRIDSIPGLAGPSSVDDQSTGPGLGRFDYAGSGWVSCPGCINRPGLFHSSETSSTNPGDTATFAFRGTSVDLYGLRASNQGIAEISIDGAPAVEADFYGKVRQGNQLIWQSPTLAPGTHTLTITVAGKGAEHASGTEIGVDRAVVNP